MCLLSMRVCYMGQDVRESEKVSEESEVVTAQTAALPRTLHINVIIPLYMIAVRFKK